MKDGLNNNIEMRNASVVADPKSFGYALPGRVLSPHRVNITTTTSSLTLSQHLGFFYGEYLKGILFIAMSMFYIFAVPRTLSHFTAVRIAMGRSVKRTVDITGAIVGLLLTSPLWLIVPILIKLDSPGKVFYSQIRVGQNRRSRDRRFYQRSGVTERRNSDRRQANCFGKPFRVLKFRTMVNDAEKTSGAVWAQANDPRITRLGNFLRKSRIDEIPQFINILMGDMSLVGPRPERPEFVSELVKEVPNYADRLAVKPGLTGLAQVENGYDSSIDSVHRKVAYDLEYIRTWSLWKDIQIMLKTVVVVCTGKGAH